MHLNVSSGGISDCTKSAYRQYDANIGISEQYAYATSAPVDCGPDTVGLVHGGMKLRPELSQSGGIRIGDSCERH